MPRPFQGQGLTSADVVQQDVASEDVVPKDVLPKDVVPADVARGEYVARTGGCEACHTVKDGAPYAGGYELDTKFGVFYAPNITPSAEGIGGWSQADFVRAMREGRGPDGHAYWPAFPYTSYTRMTDGDLADLYAYLRTVAPSSQTSKDQDVRWPYRWFLGVWRALAFHPRGEYVADPDHDDVWNRGAYLVTGPGHCGECHTPRSAIGAAKKHRFLAGNDDPPEPSPNITPSADGIGDWSADDVVTLLQSGMTPDGDFAGAGMRIIVADDTSKLTDDDRRAMAAYLLTVPARPSKGSQRSSGSGDDPEE